MRIIAGVCGLVLLSTAAFAQSDNSKNCSVDGSVTNSITGAPVLRAQVSVVVDGEIFFGDSDAAGQWTVEHIPCGQAAIDANRVGFLRTQPRTGSGYLLVANTPLHDVKLSLKPQAAIAGRVLDDQGDPIQGVQVNLITSRIVNGVRGIQANTSMVTNDLGEYRFANISAGRYIVCANAGGGVIGRGESRAYSGKCYPGPMNSSPVDAMIVAAGDESPIDFALTALATVNVSGIVSGQPEGVAAVVSLMPAGQIARMWADLSSRTRADGTFVIRNVPPGAYVALADWGPLSARVPIQVGAGDIDGLHLELERGVTIGGTVRVVSATGRKLAKPQNLFLLRDTDPLGPGGSQDIVWDESKTSFTAPDLRVGNYRLELSPPAPFYVRSATMGGRDIAGAEFAIGPGAGNIEIVLGDDGGAVEGDVATDEGAVPGWVLLEKNGTARRNVRTDGSGHFKIDNVAPGDYKVYAWDDNANVEYGNAEWMEQNGKGVAVTVAPGATAQVEVVRQTAPVE